ncbi:hypothetical protein RSAG8_10695, partial [Rhizoctonia solani AG-8 WAC10335]
MDDNFSSIVSAIMWGRCVNDSVRKFLQFQILVNITAVLITFISAVSSDEEESVLTAVQLLWINIIMDTFAALALATDPASPESLKRMPDRKTAPLFSVDMGKMIIVARSQLKHWQNRNTSGICTFISAFDGLDCPNQVHWAPLVLASLVDPKSLQSLEAIGGTEGLLRGLGTDTNLGLRSWQFTDSGQNHDPEKGDGGGAGAGGDTPQSRASVEDRRRVYGANVMPSRKSKSLLLLMWLALKDKVLVLLSIAAVVSLALGLYSDFGTPPELAVCSSGEGLCETPRVDWVEGVAIMIAIIIVVVVGSLNDWQKERQFRKLNDKKEDRGVKVIRDGKEQVINVKEVLVGDIALLEPGEIVPCDGVFLRGHNVRCDESGATGESDAIKKVTYEECMAEAKGLKPGDKSKLDCFIVSGAKVLEGVGQYVVIAVGPKSFNGRIMMALSGDTESTPLQLKLNALAELIAKLGSAAGLILFTALMIKFFVQLKTKSSRTANEKAMSFVQILIISVTLIVVAVPEGLPLAVTLALAFATKRMTKERLLVRVPGSCETMANASVVCTDKTGTLPKT